MLSAFAMLNSKLDTLAGQVFWDYTQYYIALNEGQLEFAARIPGIAQVTSTLTCSAGSELANLPLDLFIPQQLVTEEGHHVWPVDLVQLENEDAGWRSITGRPQFVTWYDWARVRVWPIPDTTYEYTLKGVPYPDEISTSTYQCPLGLEYQEALTSIAASRLLAFTRPDLAQQERAAGEEWLERFKRTLRKRGVWDTLRLRPGTGWSLAPGGTIPQGRRYR